MRKRIRNETNDEHTNIQLIPVCYMKQMFSVRHFNQKQAKLNQK
jgi:hypothetical protein